MCGRYWIDGDAWPQLAQLRERNPELKTCGEIFPGDVAPVICKSRAGNVRAFAMEWGFGLPNGKRVINARSETAAQKPMFRESMESRRCVLPMNAYFEWEKQESGRQKYRISPGDGEAFCLAGLYRFENGAPRFAVLTMEAAAELAFIHPRMPLILPYDRAEDWLNGGEPLWQLKMKLEIGDV